MNMNRNRILARLRSIHARSSKQSNRTATVRRLQTMAENLNCTTSEDSAQSSIANLRTSANEIGHAFSLLEASSNKAVTIGQRDGLIISLLKLLDNLPSAEDLKNVLTSFALPKDNRFQGQQDIVNTITKLRKYRASCEFLCRAASASTIFRNIAVEEVSIRRSTALNTRGSTQSFTDCLNRMGLAWNDEMGSRLNATLPNVSLRFQNEMANLKPKIHAEIQLVFFYEQHDHLRRPRVICSSKSACYLCNLFIRLHGKFLLKRTHGVLYPKWTLPTVHDVSLSEETRRIVNRLVDAFQIEIRMEVGKSLHLTRPRRIHPAESLFSLQMWSDSNKSVIAPSAVAPGRIMQPVSGIIDQKSIHSDQIMRNNSVKAGATQRTPPPMAPRKLELATNDDPGTRQ